MVNFNPDHYDIPELLDRDCDGAYVAYDEARKIQEQEKDPQWRATDVFDEVSED